MEPCGRECITTRNILKAMIPNLRNPENSRLLENVILCDDYVKYLGENISPKCDFGGM